MKLKVADEGNNTELTAEEKIAETEFLRKELYDKLKHVSMMYQEQYDGIEKRLQNRSSKMWVSIATFLVVMAVDTLFSIILSTSGGEILAMAWETWLAAVFLFMAVIKTCKDMISNIFYILVHTEKKFLKKYIQKYEIFTMKAEAEYCRDKLKEVIKLMEELNSSKDDIQYGTFSECEYIRKYADEDIYDFFYAYRTVIIIFVVAIFLVYMMVL